MTYLPTFGALSSSGSHARAPRRRSKKICLGLLALLALAPAAQAQVPCSDHAELQRALRETYGEVPVLRGVTAAGLLIELYASAERTWTLVITRPDGRACVPLTGDGYEPAPQPAPGTGS